MVKKEAPVDLVPVTVVVGVTFATHGAPVVDPPV